MKKKMFSILLSIGIITMTIIASVSSFASVNYESRKIVVFKENVNNFKKDELLKKHGVAKQKDLVAINGVVVTISQSSKLEEESEVLYIEDDYIVTINGKKDKIPPTETTPQPVEVIPWGIDYRD